MINIKNIGKILLLTTLFSLSSCSDDDDKVPAVNFPELQEIECAVNSTSEISFEASGNWKISSSSLWCQFVVDGAQMNSYQGKAGNQKIQIKVTNDATELLKSYTANIVLEMNGQEKIIYKVTRPAKGYEINVMDLEQTAIYNEENPVTLQYSGDTKIKISANCVWKLESAPEWMKIKNSISNNTNLNAAVCGSADEVITAESSVLDLYKYLPRKGNIVLVNQNSQLRVTIPVVFDGMPEDEIDFSLAPNNRFNWVFSADSYTVTNTSGLGETSSMDAPMSIKVWAKDQEYRKILLIRDNYGYMQMNPWDAWYYVDDAKNSEDENLIEISVKENTGAERNGCVMVFPKAVYENIGDFDGTVLTDDYMDIKDQYLKYVAFDFKQEAAQGGNSGFKILEMGYNPIDPNYLMDMSMQMGTDELIGMFGTSNVWMFSPERGYSSLMVTPIGLDCEFEISTIFDGMDTKFDEVEIENMGESFMIYNLEKSHEGQEMKICFRNMYTGELLSVLIVSPWF